MRAAGSVGPAGTRAWGPVWGAPGDAGERPSAGGVRPAASSGCTGPCGLTGCPAGVCGWSWVVAAAVRPAAAATPGPAAVAGWFPVAGRGCTGLRACELAGVAGPLWAVDAAAPPEVVGAGAAACWAGGATGVSLGCSACFFPRPRRPQKDCLDAGGGGGSHTGTAPAADRASAACGGA
jgi:hypothetical protein